MSESHSSVDQEEQNYSLQEDVVHLEQLLSGSRLECVEISENCAALNQQMIDCIRYSSEHSELEDFELQDQQRRLEEEKRLRIDRNRVAIQEQLKVRQFDVVDKLFLRIEEYRTRCARLEAALAKHGESQEALKDLPDTSLQNCSSLDHDALLLRLNHEKKRCQSLSQINVYLRSQLEVATDANRQLTNDIEKLTTEWHQTRKEWEEKESEFQREGQSFAEFSIKEQHQYLIARRGMLQLHHDFTKTKDFIKKDLSTMQSQLQHFSHVIPIVLSRFQTLSPTSTVIDVSSIDAETQAVNQEELSVMPRFEEEKVVLNTRIEDLLSSLQKKQSIIDEKEGINIALNKTIESLNAKIIGSTPKSDDDVDVMHRCCQALKDIAQQAVDDLDQRTWLGYKSVDLSDIRKTLLSNTPHSVQSLCDNQVFIDGSIAAIKSILQQRNMQVEKLNIQITSNKDKIKSQQRVVGNLEDEKKQLTLLNGTLESQLAAAHATVQDFMKDTHKIQATLEETGTQKSWLEHMRKTLTDQIESLNAENERLTQAQANLYQKIERLQQDRDKLKLSEQTAIQDLNRSNKKITMLETHLEETEKRHQTTQQKLQELSLDKDILEQERTELAASLNKLEKLKTESEAEVSRLQAEQDTLKNTVESLEMVNESLTQEKLELTNAHSEASTEIESVKSKHLKEKAEYEQERQSLNEKLAIVQEKCSDLEAEIEKIKSDLASIEETKTNIEEEKNQVQLERDGLNSQVTMLAGQKKVLEDELMQIKQELDFRKETCAKLTREKECLARVKAELEVRAESAEAELLQQKQVGEALKEEKESLEKALYAAEQLLMALQEQKREIEDEFDNDKSRTEFAQKQLDDLKKQRELDLETFAREKDALNKKIQQTENEYHTTLQKEKQHHNESVASLKAEKESLHDQFEAAQGEFMRQRGIQQDELQEKHEQEIAELKKQMILHEKELQDRIFLSFNEKQKMHPEEQCLAKVTELQKTIEDLEEKLREYELRSSDIDKGISTSTEHYKWTIETLESEKEKLKEEINSLGIQQEKVVKSLDHRISRLIDEREEALKNVHELQVQLEEHKVEKNQLEREIENYMQSADDGKIECQDLEQQNMTLMQRLHNERSGREIVEKTYEDLKEKTKKYQMENSELRNLLQEARQKRTENMSGPKIQDSPETLRVLHELERARQDEKRTSQTLQRRLNSLEAHYESKEREVEEIKILMAREEEIATELKSEIMKWKQKVMEGDASREASLTELNLMRHKLSDTEHKVKALKGDHNTTVQQLLEAEQKYMNFRLGMEKSLSEVNGETQTLRLKLSSAEGKVTALETKILKLESSKRDAESKLHSLNFSLRSALGLGSDSGFQTSSVNLFSTPLSSKRGSPVKFSDTLGSRIREVGPIWDPSLYINSPVSHNAAISVSELDIDLVKTALQDFGIKLYHTERERDKLKTELASYERQFQEMKENQSADHLNLMKVNKEMNLVIEENKELNNQLSYVKNNIMYLEENIAALKMEKQQLSDKNANLLHSISVLEADKSKLEATISQLRKVSSQLQQENFIMSESRNAVESKLLKADAAIRELELERMELQEFSSGKKTEIETLEHKVQHLNQSLLIMEHKNESLNSTISSLNSIIEKHKSKEKAFLDKVNILEQTLTETNFDLQSITKELGMLKGKHAGCELEKSSLQNKIENLRGLITDLQQTNQTLKDRIQTASDDLKEAEFRKAELEGKIQGYKAIIAQNEGLEGGVSEKVRNLEREKYHLEEQLTIMKTALKETEEHRLAAERDKQKAEKERSHLKRIYEKLQNEKTLTEELAGRSVRERSALGKSLSKMEVENQVLNQKIQSLQAKLAETEQRHLEKLKELDQKEKLETDLEISRLRTSKQQLEHIVTMRNREHDSVVASLEGQLVNLKEQINLSHHFPLSSYRLTSTSRLHAMSSDSLDQTLGSLRQVYVKSVGSDPHVVKATSTSDLTQSAPPKIKPASSYKRSNLTPKARKRLENVFKH